MTVDKGKNKKSKYKSFLKLLILCFAFILFALVIHYNNYRSVSPLPDKALCSSCHSMQANVTTWKVTSHGQIGCSKCHDDISLTNVFFKEVSGRYNSPIQKKHAINDDNCLSCHNTTRTVTGPGDLIMPHRLHIEKQIDCVRCHSNITHGKVAKDFLLALETEPINVTIDDAKELTAFGNRVPMAECMACHNDAKAAENCAACHTNKPVPSSHDKTFMTYSHNNAALSDLKSCVGCHEYDVKKQAKFEPKNKDFSYLRTYTRSNNFCQDCHQQRPITHDENFIINHPKGINSDSSCLVCHDKKQKELKNAPAARNTYCNTCHHNDTTHSENYLREHPKDLRTKDSNSCFSCHNANSCESCHTTYGINK